MNNIPVITIEGTTLPDAWEQAVVATWERGLRMRTEYDKPNDEPSRDCTMILIVNEPMTEPRIHRAFPGGLEDLEVYRREVVDGVHDHWINPEEGKWSYTYHQRLRSYSFGKEKVDQIGYIIEKLSQSPHSRRAQGITWNPLSDPPSDDPPCLQRIWCRLVELPGGKFSLNMNTHWRSRDAYKAGFMNIFAITDMQRIIAGEISENIGRSVSVGRYVDISDSFHIYGSYAKEFDRFLNTIRRRNFTEKTWNSEFAAPFFEDAQKRLALEKGSQ
ncbi:MAG: thymidylate synthase [Candidatus Omnitrophota bacterium]